ncbi:MAG: B12-binding domain-containing radical SAM protein [Candidatus Moranbacteria bacterium]|nr:B12-binding domain-containing radical SAM protein [Candidatus Moranbacteria bacterium]
MEILLVNPGEKSPYPAMGLAELAAFIKNHGFSVGIVDFSRPETTEEDITDSGAKIVGISVPCGLVARGLALASHVKENMNASVVFGGYYPTFCYSECLANDNVDFCVLGEGELPFLKLANLLLRQKGTLRMVPGIAYKGEEGVVVNKRVTVPNLDFLPDPAFDLLFLERYPQKEEGKLVATLSTGRGCSFGCIYCSQSAFWERRVRFRSVSRILQILNTLLGRYPANYLRILDDIFPMRPRVSLEIASMLSAKGIDWECQARIDVVEEELLKEFSKNRLDRIFFGVESGSPKIQQILGKKLDPDKVKRIISAAKKLGLRVKVSFQLGTPGETSEDVDMSIKLARELEADDIALFVSTPFFGTPLYNMAVEKGLITLLDPDDCDPSTVTMGTGELSAESVKREAERFLWEVPNSTWGHHSKKGRILRSLL